MFCVFPCVFAAFYFSQQFYQMVINGRLLSTYSSSFLFYIFGVLLNQGIVWIIKFRSVFGSNIWTFFSVFFRFQGSYCPEKKLFIRWIASAWCLAAFVLVTTYNSLLISYVTTPNSEPLIHSVQDLSNASKIHVVVNAGQGFDVAISVFKKIIFHARHVVCVNVYHAVLYYLCSV
jgi:hypothetical protein